MYSRLELQICQRLAVCVFCNSNSRVFSTEESTEGNSVMSGYFHEAKKEKERNEMEKDGALADSSDSGI